LRVFLSLLVVLAAAVLILSVFTVLLPPGISNPVRAIYDQGVYLFAGMAHSLGINAAPAYYLVGPE
jgi:hypothetical protein